MLTTFNAQSARAQFENRIGSLEADTKRCFWEIPGGPGAAFFPAVLYAFATIDYFSSYWAGWNDSGGDRAKNQTNRLTSFMVKYLGYAAKESKIAVNIWRHKLMHTGEPRVLRARTGSERYLWETGINLQNHLKLDPTGAPNEFAIRFDSYAIVRDLRIGVFGSSGYLQDLSASQDLQQKFLACFNEMETYTVDV